MQTSSTLTLSERWHSTNSLKSLSETQILKKLSSLSDDELVVLAYDWAFYARENQLPPETEWSVWLILAGRGFGKTRTGAEWTKEKVESGECGRLALIAPTSGDARDVMIEGESGILATASPWFKPVYEPSKRRLTWPNGAVAFSYSAEEPERLRGPQHDGGWLDEMCAWKYLVETWDMYQFGLRLGENPQSLISTTPKPTKFLKNLMQEKDTEITKGSTYDNLDNLAPTFRKRVIDKYEGTRLGRQELNAEVLDDNPDALWTSDDIELHRISFDDCPDLIRLCVAVDPAGSTKKKSDETGIIIAGCAMVGDQLHGYVLEDATVKAKPLKWGRVIDAEYRAYEADRVVGESNYGGDMVESTIRSVNKDISYESVHASRGKAVRAEPVSSLYEQGRIHHVGVFGKLEDEMTDWNPLDPSAPSPNRVDALVWAIFWLFRLDQDEKKPSNVRTFETRAKDRED